LAAEQVLCEFHWKVSCQRLETGHWALRACRLGDTTPRQRPIGPWALSFMPSIEAVHCRMPVVLIRSALDGELLKSLLICEDV
jgi:hypothetical protein